MSIDERVAYLEGKSEDHTRGLTNVRDDIRDVRGEIRDLRGEVHGLRGDMNRRFESIDIKFHWLIGTQIGVLIAIIGALLRR